MGSWDGAETCELIGTYILDSLKDIIPCTHVGIYRDDGLGVINGSPQHAEKVKKKLCEKFKEFGLQITVQTNTTIADYLDVTLNLKEKEYKPYAKPESSQMYVHKESNHPPVVAKRIPNSIQQRLSNISSNARLFEENKQPYEEALKKAGYNTSLTYTPPDNVNANNNTNAKQHKRKRNIIWFTPPYSRNVSTNVGKRFLQIVDNNFPPGSKLHRIFNRNSLKISYSCMDNMQSIINKHNKMILNKQQDRPAARCNCRVKKDCPLPNQCTITNVVYEAKLESSNKKQTYIGLTSNMFKTRYSQHKLSLTNRTYKNSTALSREKWKLEDSKPRIPHKVSWRILKRSSPYSPITKTCPLCLWEKYFIITADKDNMNSKSELVGSCRHRQLFKLCEYG